MATVPISISLVPELVVGKNQLLLDKCSVVQWLAHSVHNQVVLGLILRHSGDKWGVSFHLCPLHPAVSTGCQAGVAATVVLSNSRAQTHGPQTQLQPNDAKMPNKL